MNDEASWLEIMLQKTELPKMCNNTRRKALVQEIIKIPFC